jgi:hypothetical protein
MGQSITVQSKKLDGFCVFTTDRVITGQDGERFGSSEEAASADGFAAELAVRLFSGDESIEHVYIAASDVIVGRAGGWDGGAVNSAEAVIANLYRHYDSAEGAA